MKDRTLLIACLAVGVALAVSLPAQALSLGGYQGELLFEVAAGQSAGTNYGFLAPSSSFGGSSYTTSNVDALDSIAAGATPGVHPNNAGAAQPWLIGTTPSEDTFGIGEVKRIHAGHSTSDPVIYEAGAGGPNPEILAVFYGNEDFSIETNSDGDQGIYGAGLRIDFYENPLGTFPAASDGSGNTGFAQGTDSRNHAPPAGPASVGELYNGISNGGGSLLWSMISEPGFVSPSRPDATFQSNVSFAGTTDPTQFDTEGAVYASVGTTAGGTGSMNDMIDFDFWKSSIIPGNDADVWISFDSDTQGVPGDWQTNLNDDAKTFYAPEPAGILLAFLAAPIAGVVQVMRRRRRKKA